MIVNYETVWSCLDRPKVPACSSVIGSQLLKYVAKLTSVLVFFVPGQIWPDVLKQLTNDGLRDVSIGRALRNQWKSSSVGNDRKFLMLHQSRLGDAKLVSLGLDQVVVLLRETL